MSTSRRTFAELLICVAFCGTVARPLTAWADPDNDVASEYTDLAAEAAEVEANISSMRRELSIAIDEYDTCMQRYQDALTRLQEAQGRIDTLTLHIQQLQKRLATRMRVMYKSDTTTLLDFLLGLDDIDEFNSTWEVFNNLNAGDSNLVADIKIARKKVETERDECVRQEQEAAEQLRQATELMTQVEIQIAQYQAEIAGMSPEIAALLMSSEADREAAWAAAYSGVDEDPLHPDVIEYAISRIGCPYVWGAKGPEVFDCSGLTSWCYAAAGIYIPSSTVTQYEYATSNGEILPVSSVRPGDVLYVGYNGAGSAGHVGIYIGAGQFIHAPAPGDYVKVSANMGMWTFALRF